MTLLGVKSDRVITKLNTIITRRITSINHCVIFGQEHIKNIPVANNTISIQRNRKIFIGNSFYSNSYRTFNRNICKPICSLIKLFIGSFFVIIICSSSYIVYITILVPINNKKIIIDKMKLYPIQTQNINTIFNSIVKNV